VFADLCAVDNFVLGENVQSLFAQATIYMQVCVILYYVFPPRYCVLCGCTTHYCDCSIRVFKNVCFN